jgi:2-polyprenyl-6-methoxyphenol hydroxylase-like FAD-dependent oxidoreductase
VRHPLCKAQFVRVLVVGAGIGGLTCGVGLQHAGFDVEIVERAGDLAGIGAGISLWPNALAALNELGVEAAVAAEGIEFASGNIRRPSGEPFSIFEPEQMRRYFDGMPVLMHRADLQRVLLDAAKNIDITLGTGCQSVVTEGEEVTVRLSDGSTRTADLVVGADGVRSAVRASVDPSRPRYVGLAAWRAVISTAVPVRDSWLSIGHGKQFLAAPLSEGRTYVSGLLPMSEGAFTEIPHLGPFLRESFQGWHDPIDQLIGDTPEDAYIRGDVYDRPRPSRLCWGRVALIGDAAHPVTPDLGQGGCLAIEDAVVLARCLQLVEDIPGVLKLYEQARLPRVRTIVFESHWTGKVFASPNPVIEAIRSAILRGMPTRTRLRHLSRYASRDAFLKGLPPMKEASRG